MQRERNMRHALVIAVKPGLPVTLDGKDYMLVWPLPAVAILEDRLGRPMRSAPDWFKIKAGELQAVLHTGFLTRHAAEAEALAAKIADGLSPEAIETTIAGICETNCPDFMRRYNETLEKLRAKAKAGEALPKASSAGAHLKMPRALGQIYGRFAAAITAFRGWSSAS